MAEMGIAFAYPFYKERRSISRGNRGGEME